MDSSGGGNGGSVVGGPEVTIDTLMRSCSHPQTEPDHMHGCSAAEAEKEKVAEATRDNAVKESDLKNTK